MKATEKTYTPQTVSPTGPSYMGMFPDVLFLMKKIDTAITAILPPRNENTVISSGVF